MKQWQTLENPTICDVMVLSQMFCRWWQTQNPICLVLKPIRPMLCFVTLYNSAATGCNSRTFIGGKSSWCIVPQEKLKETCTGPTKHSSGTSATAAHSCDDMKSTTGEGKTHLSQKIYEWFIKTGKIAHSNAFQNDCNDARDGLRLVLCNVVRNLLAKIAQLDISDNNFQRQIG